MHCNLTSRRSFWAVLGYFVLHMRTNNYFAAFDQTSDIAVKFRDHDFLK